MYCVFIIAVIIIIIITVIITIITENGKWRRLHSEELSSLCRSPNSQGD